MEYPRRATARVTCQLAGAQNAAPDDLVGFYFVIQVLAGAHVDARVELELLAFHDLAVAQVAGVGAKADALVTGFAGVQNYALPVYAEDHAGKRQGAGGDRIQSGAPGRAITAHAEGAGRRKRLYHMNRARVAQSRGG